MNDLVKAFNRVSHQLVIEELADMNVPGWLLAILTSYLTGRAMFMRYAGSMSHKRELPGSTPQGTFLGILLFIIAFNGALLRPSVPRPTFLSLKYVDDLSMLQAIHLKNALSPDPVNRPFPLTHSERFQMVLPKDNNPLNEYLDELKAFTDSRFMKIKERKTMVMIFNFSQKYDFPTEINVDGFVDQLVVTTETKLLGVMISSDLKWAANTDYICKKGYKKMWILRRMKLLNVSPSILLDVYTKEIRLVLEHVPAWHSGLTSKQSDQIDRVQRVALSIILGDHRISYKSALNLLSIETLQQRRFTLCKNFVKKTVQSRHANFFVQNASYHHTRGRKTFAEQQSHTKRAFMSPLSYLTRLANSM